MTAAGLARYTKAIVGAAVAGLTATGTALADGGISAQEWIGIGLAVLATFGGVGVVTNGPSAAHLALADRVDSIEQQQVSLDDLQGAFAAGTREALQTVVTSSPATIETTAHVDLHAGKNGEPGQWPTESPEELAAR